MLTDGVVSTIREPLVIVALAIVLYGWRVSFVAPPLSHGWLRRAAVWVSLASATVAVASHLGLIAYQALNPVLNSGSAVCPFGMGMVPIVLGTVGAAGLAPFGSGGSRMAATAVGLALVGLLWTL